MKNNHPAISNVEVENGKVISVGANTRGLYNVAIRRQVPEKTEFDEYYKYNVRYFENVAFDALRKYYFDMEDECRKQALHSFAWHTGNAFARYSFWRMLFIGVGSILFLMLVARVC